MDLEKNISALWDEVDVLSQPVHVHIHGDGHLMNNPYHDHDHFDHDHDCHHLCHGHKDGEHKMCRHDKDHKGRKYDHRCKWNKMKEAKDSNNSSGGEAMMGGKGNHSHMHGGMGHGMHGGMGHGMHDGHGGTHVHIHLHTAMEEEMEMKHHRMPPPPQGECISRLPCPMIPLLGKTQSSVSSSTTLVFGNITFRR